MEWVIVWLAGDSDCVFRGYRGVILEILYGGLDKEWDGLVHLISGVDDWVVFVLDDRCLVDMKLKLLLFAQCVFLGVCIIIIAKGRRRLFYGIMRLLLLLLLLFY